MVQAFPEELFSVLRTVHLLRGLSVGLGINYSCAEQWRPIAEEVLYHSGRLAGGDFLNTGKYLFPLNTLQFLGMQIW